MSLRPNKPLEEVVFMRTRILTKSEGKVEETRKEEIQKEALLLKNKLPKMLDRILPTQAALTKVIKAKRPLTTITPLQITQQRATQCSICSART